MVAREEVFDAVALGEEGGGAVGAVYGAVEGGVGFGEGGGHGDGDVEVGEGGAGGEVAGAFVKDGLRVALDFGAAVVGDFFGPGEIVVHDTT